MWLLYYIVYWYVSDTLYIYTWKDVYVKLYLSSIWLFMCVTIILNYFKKTLKINVNSFLVILIILIVYCYLALFNSYYNF